MRFVITLLVVSLLVPGAAVAQVDPASLAAGWRDVATRAGAGADVKVRLTDGTSFRALLVRVDPESLVLQPKTRKPVPAQAVSYGAIASLEPQKKGGTSAGKAAAIGVGTGVAAFWGMMAILFAVLGD